MALSLYTYEVRDQGGNALTGQVQGENPQLVAAQLRDQGYIVVRIRETPAKVGVERRPTAGRRVHPAQLAQFYREFATMIGAGMTVIQSLHTLEEHTSQPQLRWAIRALLPGIERGERLSEQMRRFPEVFSPLAAAIVAAGEASGRLDSMLRTLAEYAEHDLEVRQMIARETLYPKILAAAIVLIVPGGLLIANLIQPGMFGLGMLLPIAFFLGAAGLAALTYYVIRAYQSSEQGRRAVDGLKCVLPVFGGLTIRLVMSRFCRALASGVSLPESVRLAADAGNNLAVAAELQRAIPHLQAGGVLSQFLATVRYVPPTVTAMLRTGEQTGNIDATLSKVADYYDDEAKTKIKQMGTAIVPICVIIGGIIVAFMMFSFYAGYIGSILDAAGGP
jgi:type II secretory pathway component PulF